MVKCKYDAFCLFVCLSLSSVEAQQGSEKVNSFHLRSAISSRLINYIDPSQVSQNDTPSPPS